MSYQITVKIPDADPEALALPEVELEGDIPAGTYEITGDDQGDRVSIRVRQRDAQGRFRVAAQHDRDLNEEAYEADRRAVDQAVAAAESAPF